MNKTVKKIAAVALSALMVGSVFAGCSSNSEKSDTTNKNTYNVGICQLTQHTALDSATKGFKDKLSELAKADGRQSTLTIKTHPTILQTALQS